jgi:hypothetical protein
MNGYLSYIRVEFKVPYVVLHSYSTQDIFSSNFYIKDRVARSTGKVQFNKESGAAALLSFKPDRSFGLFYYSFAHR